MVRSLFPTLVSISVHSWLVFSVVKKISENFAAHFPEKKVKGRFHGFQQKTIVWADPVPSHGCLFVPQSCVY